MRLDRLFVGGGALLLALTVALAAYAAHAGRAAVHPDAARLLQTAVLFQFVHALGIVIAGVLARGGPGRWLAASATLHFAGIVLFCGSLWALALAAQSMGAAAPIGGSCFIAGWLALAVHAFRS